MAEGLAGPPRPCTVLPSPFLPHLAFPARDCPACQKQLQQNTNPRIGAQNYSHPNTHSYSTASATEAEEPVPGWLGQEAHRGPRLPLAEDLCTQGRQGHLCRQAGELHSRLGNPRRLRRPLFAGQLAVKAGQGDGKGLQCTQWVVVIHREHILCYPAKLHHDVVRWGGHRRGKRERTDGDEGESGKARQVPSPRAGWERQKPERPASPAGAMQTQKERQQRAKGRGNQTPGDGAETCSHRVSIPQPSLLLTAPGAALRRLLRTALALCSQTARTSPPCRALSLMLQAVRAGLGKQSPRPEGNGCSGEQRGGDKYSRSLPWMIWKFFTEAWVTRPWKLST